MSVLPGWPSGMEPPNDNKDKRLSTSLLQTFSETMDKVRELEHAEMLLAGVRATLIVNYSRESGRMTDGVVIEDSDSGNALQLMFSVLQQYRNKVSQLQDDLVMEVREAREQAERNGS